MGIIGLHLNFELRLPASTTRASVIASLTALQAFARSLPFAHVSPLLTDLDGDCSSALGFLVQPGKGCETATFGLLRRRSAGGAPVDWFWHCSCKTQYASTVSDAHLVACHTALVRLLDHAISLGVNVVVRDETHYWESRDVSTLVSEVHTMNQLVARIAGRLSDALGDTKSVQAPIFEHALFERLEMGNPSDHLRADEFSR